MLFYTALLLEPKYSITAAVTSFYDFLVRVSSLQKVTVKSE